MIPRVGPGIPAATYARITEGMTEMEAVLGCPTGNNSGQATPDLGRLTLLNRCAAEINLGPPCARWKGRTRRDRPPNLGSRACG
jgi:hypothetical protein